MDNLEFGLTMTVFGMGGTLAILFLLSLVMDLLHKILPEKEEKQK
jgi:Na+-transporting methylmalonyl-CoA/oxaloacetate decarboxylase gamma subunit